MHSLAMSPGKSQTSCNSPLERLCRAPSFPQPHFTLPIRSIPTLCLPGSIYILETFL